jgi:3D (Asp-Asp-Asp) domain-containing protein
MTNEGGEPRDGASDEGSADGVIATIAAAVRRGASLLVDLIDRIVHGIRLVAPLVLGVGCQSTNDVANVAPPAVEVAPAPKEPPPKEETGPRALGKFTITFYYVVGEEEIAAKSLVAANDNRDSRNDARVGDGRAEARSDRGDKRELASIAPDPVTLYAGGGQCEPIAEVSKDFATQLAVQGTGKLRDGRVLNIWGHCNCKRTPCFKVTQAQWGTAGTGRSLLPFRTVAVDPKVVKLGSLLYVPLLEGRTMPGRAPWGGFVHDGCVVADDTGGHIGGNRLDLFVGRRAYFLGISGSGGSHAWARHVPVFDGSSICERKGRRVARKTGAI